MIIEERQGMAVWLNSLKYTRQLRKYGNIHYISKKMKYVILYCSVNKIEETKDRLSSLHYVKEVQLSERPFIKTEYQNAKPDKAKEYDYKMGI